MATGGLYGSTTTGDLVATSGAESTGLYGNNTNIGGTYFEWFIFYESTTAPATPTGGSWNFLTNTGTAPSGWSSTPPTNPTHTVWASISIVNSRSPAALTWTAPATWTQQGPIGTAATIAAGTTTTGAPGTSATVTNSGTSSAAVFNFQIPRGDVGATGATGATGTAATVAVGSTTTLTPGSAATVTNSGTTAAAVFNFGVPQGLTGATGATGATGPAGMNWRGDWSAGTFYSVDDGVFDTVSGSSYIAVATSTNQQPPNGAYWNLLAQKGANGTGVGTVTSVDVSGGTTGLTSFGGPITSSGTVTLAGTLNVANGGTGATTAAGARTSLGLGSAAVLTAGAANGVATLDSGGTVPLSQIPASIQGGVSYQGTWNATTNTPTLTSSVGTKGYYYVVSVAGSTNLNGVTSWNIGDWAIYNGTAWEKIDNTDAVTSVNGYTGTVVLNANDVGALSSITSTDGSVTITTPSTGVRDLSVAVSASTNNVICQVRNTTGATLTKGTAVYISGATGQIPTVSKALATSDATSAQTLGLLTADLANNSNGNVTIIGLITNIDTSAYTDGAQLYLSGTTAGTLTATKQYAPIHLVYVAVVEYAHPTQGKLFVKVQNGYELDEIHNVSAQSPTTGQTIVYNSSTSLWEKSTSPVITGTTINSTTIGATTASTGDFTTLSASSTVTLSGGTANGVAYLNGSKVLTTGSALTFDGATLGVNGVSVGRGAGAVSTNTAVGASALSANTTGSQNVAVGANALVSNTTGDLNVAIGGREQGVSNWGPMQSNTTGYSNTAVGAGSLASNTSATANAALGYMALFGNTTGQSNTGLGYQALRSNTTASNNTAVGYQAAYFNTTGNGISAFGALSLYTNSTGTGNAAFGTQYAGYYNAALYANTTGSNNNAFGSGALAANTTGSSNVAMGVAALTSNTTASNNTAVGYQAGYTNQTGAGCTYLGNQAGYLATGNYNTLIGYSTGSGLTTGVNNTFVGQGSGYTVTTGSKNTILGFYSGNQGGLDIRTLSNYLVLSDGDGNPRIYHNGTTVVIPNLPTSATGLPTGGLYVVAGVLKVA